MIEHSVRCINHKCALNKECAMFVKASKMNEQIIYPVPSGDLCSEFVELRKPYGVGKEVND